MWGFITANSAAFFALLGTLAGVAISFLSGWQLKKVETRHRLYEKVIDKRIEAHEKIMRVVKPMQAVVIIGRQSDNILKRSLTIFSNREIFTDWYGDFQVNFLEYSVWLNKKLVRELFYAQDYLANLNEFLSAVDSKYFMQIGCIIKDDFVDLSNSITRLAFEFFSKDLSKMKFQMYGKDFKYEPMETKSRLEKTYFRMRYKDLIELSGKKLAQ